MKFTLKALTLALATTASGVAFADESSKLPLGLEFSGSAAITTDYRFRGMTQTKNDPAIQVGLHLAHSSGFYAGVWGSNVDFGADSETVYDEDGDVVYSLVTSSPHLELDPYIGYSYTFEDINMKPWIDVGIWHYGYPSSNKDFAWTEYYVKGGVSDVIASGDGFNATINYTNDYIGFDKDDGWYFSLGYAVPFADTGFGANANVGYTKVKAKDSVTYFNDKNHYTDWKVGVTYDFKSISGFTAELAAVGTSISKKDLDKDVKRGLDTGAVFTLTKSF